MDGLTIGEVARRSQVPPSTLRYYEQVGLLAPPERINKQRRYTADVLQRLTLIKRSQQAGFMIAEILLLLEGLVTSEPFSVRWHKQAHKKLVEIDAQIQQLRAMQRLLETGLQCGCVRLDECVLYLNEEQNSSAQPCRCSRLSTGTA